jgi:hypothetical protein
MFIVGPRWLVALVWCLSTWTGLKLFAFASVVVWGASRSARLRPHRRRPGCESDHLILTAQPVGEDAHHP